MLDRDSPTALAFFASIERLEKADHDEALEMRALVLHLCGDIDGAMTALGQREHKDLLRDLCILANYNQCSLGQKLFATACAPTTGDFWRGSRFAFPIGAFRKLAEFAREAERMHLQSQEAASLEEIYMIDEVLSDLGVTDEDAGRVMELAGDVLAQHGVMFLGPRPEIEIINHSGEQRTFHLTYRIAVSATDAVTMYMKFIEQLFYREIDMPHGFHISFGGSTA